MLLRTVRSRGKKVNWSGEKWRGLTALFIYAKCSIPPAVPRSVGPRLEFPRDIQN